MSDVLNIPVSKNFQEVSDSLKRLGFKFFTDTDNSTFRLSFTTQTYTYEAAVVCGSNYVSASVRYPFTVGEEYWVKVLDMINDVNISTPVGNIELWKELKTVVVRYGIHAESPPSDETVRFLILRAISLAETNAKKLMAMLA